MKEKLKILIIYPQWIPCNQVGVMRIRLLANGLAENGADIHLLTIDPRYDLSAQCEDLKRLVDPAIKVHYVPAWRKRPWLPNGVIYRGFGQLVFGGIKLCKQEKFDWLIGSALPGETLAVARVLHSATGIPYAVDYQDPWALAVRSPAPFFSKQNFSTMLAKMLEGFAVRKAALFTGVSELSYLNVMRHYHIREDRLQYVMPVGFDWRDYNMEFPARKLLWDNDGNVLPILYAGAFLPGAVKYIETLFSVLADLKREQKLDRRLHFYFVGTADSKEKKVLRYAERYGVGDLVTEYPERIPYPDVLAHLNRAQGILAIGSVLEHYTASKIFQALLSKKPVFGVFHHKSSVNEILKACGADKFLVRYLPEKENGFKDDLRKTFEEFCRFDFLWEPDLRPLESYSAPHLTAGLLREMTRLN